MNPGKSLVKLAAKRKVYCLAVNSSFQRFKLKMICFVEAMKLPPKQKEYDLKTFPILRQITGSLSML